MSHRYSSLSVRALAVLVFALLQHVARATELTFELQDKEEHCFYEVAPKAGSKLALEYQVVYGGQLDVDVVVRDPNNVIVYEEPKKTIDDKTFVADTPGEYEVCFSNKFSSFSHKTIYIDIFVDDYYDPLADAHKEEATVLTQMATTAVNIHDTLRRIIDSQTHHRVNEMHGRNLAEDLNSRVKLLSFAQAVMLIIVAIGQVYMVRNFFKQ